MRLPVDNGSAEVASLYHAADARIQGLIREAVNAGIDPKTGELRRIGTKNYYTRQLAAVRKVLVELQTGAIPKATALVGTAYVQGATYVDEALGTSGAFAGVHREAVETLADNMTNGLNEAASRVGRQAEDIFRQVGLEESALGILEGSTRKHVTKAMIDNLVRQGATSFVDKAGRRWTLGSYASMVARTTTREAVSMGTANRLVENGHDLVTISKHSHDRDECSDYEGKTFSLSGDDSTYPELDRYPPFHPNCVHVLTPAAATFEEFEKSVGAADARADRKLTEPDDPFDAAADRIRAQINTFEETDAFRRAEYTINKLAPNGMNDPDLDLPWASDGETKRQRIDAIIAQAKSTDVDYVIGIGGKIEEEVALLTDVQRTRITDSITEAKAFEEEKNIVLSRTRDKVLRLPHGSAEREAGNEELKRIGIEWSEANQRVWSLEDELRNVDSSTRLRILERIRPGYGTGDLKVLRKSKVSEMVRKQARFLPKEWIDASTRKGGISTKATKGRAHYSPTDEQIVVREGNNSVALHELAHRVEHARPSVVRAQYEFYLRRTSGEEKRYLMNILPGHGYGANEVTREDRFTNPYMGKDYGGNAFELLTMGLEGIFYKRHGLIGVVRPQRIVSKLVDLSDELASTTPGSPRALHIESIMRRLERQNPEGTDTEYVSWIMGLLAVG